MSPVNPPFIPSVHPGQTQGSLPAKVAGSLGHLVIGTALSVTVAPIIGAVTGTVATIKGLRAANQLNLAIKTEKQLQTTLDTKQALLCSNPSIDRKQAQEEIKQLSIQLSSQKETIQDIKNTLQQHKQTLIASIFTLIPFLGLHMAAAYLRANNPTVHDKGIHGNVEALLQSIDTGKSATIQGMLYPLTGETMDKVKEEYGDFWTPVNNAFKHIGAKETSIPVNREDGQNHALQAFTIPAKDSDTFDPSKPTMVCFHGNGQTMHAMLSQADTYRNMGFNVVLPTMGGYPGSDEGLKTSETTTYQDANAVIEFLKKQGVNEIALHGTSIGGTLAFAAAELHPDVVKFVVADQTLNRAKDVAANLLRNNIGSLVPTCVVRGIVGSAFAPGQAVPGVKTADGKPYKTDGLDSNRKAAQLREREEQGKGSCEVYAIKSSHDFFMGRAGDKEKGFNENFADDLAAARYGTNQGHTVQIKGGHCTWFNKNDNDLHVQQLKNQLTSKFNL